MDRNKVERAVLVQLLGCCDNEYLLGCVQRFPGRFSAVVAVDPAGPDAMQQLAALRDRGASGLRLRPTARSAGNDPHAVWRAAARLNLPVSCVGNAETFAAPEFHDLLQGLPTLTVVIEHLGGTSTPDANDAMKSARARVLDLARFSQVYMKVPGLGELEPRMATLAGRAPPLCLADAAATLGRVLEAFGPGRLMWGSDFPVVGMREGYANALEWPRKLIQDLCGPAGDAVFTSTARAVYRIP